MSSSKRIFTGVFWTILGSVINALFGFVSVPILLFHFGKAQYGLIGVAFSVNVYLRLMDMGFSSGNVKFFSQWLAKNEFSVVSKLFQSSLVFYGSIGLINACILSIISYNAQSIFSLNNSQTEIIHNMFYVLMISAFFGWISSLLDQFLRANEIIGWEQRLLIFAKLLQILILALTVTYNFSITKYFLLTTFSSLIILPFSIIKIRALNYKVSFFPRYYHEVFKQVLPYSLSIFSFSIFQFSASYLRPVLLSIRSGVEPVADYRILEGFANVIMLTGASFVGVMLPMASKASALGNKDSQNKLAYNGTKYISIFLAIVCFGFILVSKDLLELYVGKNYAYLVIWLNIWVLTLLSSHSGALSSLVLSGNNMKPIVFISAFSAISSLAIAWFLVPEYHVGGVVLGYFFYCLIQIVFYYAYYYSRILKLDSNKILVKCFLTPSGLIGLCSGVVYVISRVVTFQRGFIRIAFTEITFILIVAPILFFVIFTQEDKIFIKGLLARKKTQ